MKTAEEQLIKFNKNFDQLKSIYKKAILKVMTRTLIGIINIVAALAIVVINILSINQSVQYFTKTEQKITIILVSAYGVFLLVYHAVKILKSDKKV